MPANLQPPVLTDKWGITNREDVERGAKAEPLQLWDSPYCPKGRSLQGTVHHGAAGLADGQQASLSIKEHMTTKTCFVLTVCEDFSLSPCHSVRVSCKKGAAGPG